MEDIYFYEDRYVSKGRKKKNCVCCEKIINIGKPSYILTYVCYGEFDNLSVCPTCYNEKNKDGDMIIDEYFSNEFKELDNE